MSEFGKTGSAVRDWGDEGGEHKPTGSAVPQRASEVMSRVGIAAMQGPADEDEVRPEPNFARAEQPIKDFLAKYLGPDREKTQRQYPSPSVDISAPRHADMEAIASGNYSVRSIVVLPELKHITCYVGATEFHFSGPAAEEIIATIGK